MHLTGSIDTGDFEHLGERLDEFINEFADEFDRRVRRRTPVDTGLAQASWELYIGPTYIELVNPQPYAERLENGWSQQAPLGMLRITVEEAPQMADDIIRRLNI